MVHSWSVSQWVSDTCHLYCVNGRMIGEEWKDGWGWQERQAETNVDWGWLGGDEASMRERKVPWGGSTYTHSTRHLAVSDSKAAWPVALTEVQTNQAGSSAKRNSSYSTYSILFLTYTSYFGGKKGISRNKMKFCFLMHVTMRARNGEWRCSMLKGGQVWIDHHRPVALGLMVKQLNEVRQEERGACCKASASATFEFLHLLAPYHTLTTFC